LALPKSQFWNLKFTIPKLACNLKLIHYAPGCDSDRPQNFDDDWNVDDAGIARACWVAKADAVCWPRFATAPEKVMGSVNNTILGSIRFISCRQRTSGSYAIGAAVRSRRTSRAEQILEP
jgi:hypothetical protein